MEFESELNHLYRRVLIHRTDQVHCIFFSLPSKSRLFEGDDKNVKLLANLSSDKFSGTVVPYVGNFAGKIQSIPDNTLGIPEEICHQLYSPISQYNPWPKLEYLPNGINCIKKKFPYFSIISIRLFMGRAPFWIPWIALM